MLRSKNYGGDTNCSLAADDVSAGKKPKVKKMFHSNMEGKTKIDAYQSKMFLPLLLFIVLAMASTGTAEAQFNFTVVNNTGYSNNLNRGFYKLEGYEHRYRLTSEGPNQSVAMWNNKKIDLAKDFIIDMKLFFGTKHLIDAIGREDGADGIAFVMHRKNPSNLIGRNGGFLGYAYGTRPKTTGTNAVNTTSAADSIENMSIPGVIDMSIIDSSFAVEFDTFSNGNTEWDEQGHASDNHISYLKDGYIDAIDGAHQMQNDWGNAETGEWYCVRIKWVRSNGINGNDGYDLITYMEEYTTGELTQRHTMHFNTLSELIDGLTIVNGKAEVTWGVTSATGTTVNKHQAEYVNILNADFSKE